MPEICHNYLNIDTLLRLLRHDITDASTNESIDPEKQVNHPMEVTNCVFVGYTFFSAACRITSDILLTPSSGSLLNVSTA